MKILPRRRLANVVDPDPTFDGHLNEFTVLGQELRQTIDDVHALFHGAENDVSLGPIEKRGQGGDAVDKVIGN